MLAPEILRQIKMLELRTGRAVTDVMAGQYVSAFKGRGMEFDEVREYTPGDEVRLIDWNVTARLGAPHVKVLREERELTVMIVCDVSASQSFQGFHRAKREVAAEMAAVIAFLAARSQDRVGLVLASDKVEQCTPPRKGRGHVWRLIREVLTHVPVGTGTDLDSALRFVDRVQKRRALIFVVSDFLGDSVMSSALGQLARRHDVVAVRMVDPLEQLVPGTSPGIVRLRDAETGQEMIVDADDPEFRAAFARWWQDRNRHFRDWVNCAGARTFDLRTDGNTLRVFADFLAGSSPRRGTA